jgi:hypothetical protein
MQTKRIKYTKLNQEIKQIIALMDGEEAEQFLKIY